MHICTLQAQKLIITELQWSADVSWSWHVNMIMLVLNTAPVVIWLVAAQQQQPHDALEQKTALWSISSSWCFHKLPLVWLSPRQHVECKCTTSGVTCFFQWKFSPYSGVLYLPLPAWIENVWSHTKMLFWLYTVINKHCISYSVCISECTWMTIKANPHNSHCRYILKWRMLQVYCQYNRVKTVSGCLNKPTRLMQCH